MKTIKRVIAMLLCVMMIMSAFACRKDTDNSTVKITLSEVAHSIFYAPQYVSIELGYFEDESIDLNLVTGFGADKVMTALVSKEADIGFMGSESSIYVYQEGSTDYAVNFAQLTQQAIFLYPAIMKLILNGIILKAGQFLVAEPVVCLRCFSNISLRKMEYLL